MSLPGCAMQLPRTPAGLDREYDSSLDGVGQVCCERVWSTPIASNSNAKPAL
jgi:hypothetical protein